MCFLTNREQGAFGESGEDSAKVKILEEDIARKEVRITSHTVRINIDQYRASRG